MIATVSHGGNGRSSIQSRTPAAESTSTLTAPAAETSTVALQVDHLAAALRHRLVERQRAVDLRIGHVPLLGRGSKNLVPQYAAVRNRFRQILAQPL